MDIFWLNESLNEYIVDTREDKNWLSIERLK